MALALTAPVVPVGQIKSFGPLGPCYQVGRPLRRSADGDWMVEIILLDSGETAEYSLIHLLDDPVAS